MKKSLIIYAILLLIVVIAPIGFLSAYTINKELRYTVLDATYEGSTLLSFSALLYLKHSDRIYTENAYPYTLLSFVLSNYAQKGVNSKNVLILAKLLLDRGVSIDAYNNKGTTALHEAVMTRQADIVAFLLQQGADKATLTNYPETGSRTNQMSALELAQWLNENSQTAKDWSEVIALLQQ